MTAPDWQQNDQQQRRSQVWWKRAGSMKIACNFQIATQVKAGHFSLEPRRQLRSAATTVTLMRASPLTPRHKRTATCNRTTVQPTANCSNCCYCALLPRIQPEAVVCRYGYLLQLFVVASAIIARQRSGALAANAHNNSNILHKAFLHK